MKATCPHCGFDFDDEHIWQGSDGCSFPTTPGGEETAEFHCPGCKKQLNVEVDRSPEFLFSDDEGERIEWEG